jgi:hypothetical protein
MQVHIEHVHVNTAAGTPPIDIEALMQRLAALPAPAATQANAPRIGQPWPGQGGIYAGLIRCADGDYHLIVPTADAASVESIEWGGYGHQEVATSDTDGPANTRTLVASEQSHPAAQWANGLDIEGHADWHLPSRRELRLCWVNVPELFDDGWYWTSTQHSAHTAWSQVFDGGGQDYDGKDNELRARAVRRFKAQ